jgi:flagellin-like protein
MNVFGKRERRWRKGRKRGVSPIIATILLVAITVVLAAVLYVLISGLTKGPGSTPLGTAFALGTPAQSSVTAPTGLTCATTCYTYAFTIEQAGGGITWNSVNFVVKNSGGTVAAVSGFAVWPITGPTGALSGAVCYSVATSEQSWTAGTGTGATAISTTQTLIVYMSGSASDPLAGQTLFALGVSGYSGTVQIAIP